MRYCPETRSTLRSLLAEKADRTDAGSCESALPRSHSGWQRGGSDRRVRGARYIQHSWPVKDSRDGFIEFFEDFQRRNPIWDIEIIRGFEDGPYVFLHVTRNLNNGEFRYATADILETDDDAKMIEHWDIIAEMTDRSSLKVDLRFVYRRRSPAAVSVGHMASPVRPNPLRASPFVFFSVAGLLGMLAIGGGSLIASQRAGRAEAMADVRALTHVVAKTVVEPNLTDELLAGDRASIAALDEVIAHRVLDDMTLRVKLWDASGTIVYSDEPMLIGETYRLEDDKNRSLWSGDIVSEISGLDGPENRFEAELAGEMMEVYLPIDGPDGNPLLYESYFAMSSVSDSASRIRSEFLPIIVVPVALMGGLHFALAWGLRERIRRGQIDRERLLLRAIESSDLERRRIAADLHDGVVQDLVGTSFAVSAAAESAALHAPQLSADLRSAAVGTRRSLQSLRSLLVDIYPPNLHERGLEAALIDLLSPAGDLGIETELTIDGEIDVSPEETALLYRVIQESVRNVFRHANAANLNVDLRTGPDGTRAVIVDDGSGFATPSQDGGHLGLRLLADLTADAGACFTVDSEPGVGTTIRLELAP